MKVPFNHLLKEDRPLIGTLLTSPATEIAEIIAEVGFDWVFIDMEHGSIEPSQVQKLLQTLKGGPAALVRVPENTATWFKKALDAGADGVIVPLVNTPEDARLAVSYSKYPPMGTRSVGIARAQGYGVHFADYVKSANDSTSLVIQLEDVRSVQNAEEILSVPGIDAAFVGPYDLSGSMGALGDVQRPEVQEAISHIREVCRLYGVPVGTFAMKAEAAAIEIVAGCRFVAVGIDLYMLSSAASETFKTTQAILARHTMKTCAGIL